MALLHDYMIENTTVVVPNAYHRVEYITGNKENMTALVDVYVDEESYLSNQRRIGFIDLNFKLPTKDNGDLKDDVNIYALAYKELKSQMNYKKSEEV